MVLFFFFFFVWLINLLPCNNDVVNQHNQYYLFSTFIYKSNDSQNVTEDAYKGVKVVAVCQ